MRSFPFKSALLCALSVAVVVAVIVGVRHSSQKEMPVAEPQKAEQQPPVKRTYIEKSYPTPNYDKKRKNAVAGVVLHHTALPTVEESLEILTSLERKAGTHVVIDTDGTRYIMAEPTMAAYHAGPSMLHGREGCNFFTIGIEFQGNTLESPLTDDQIASGIDYLLPIMTKYNIPWWNVVTHEMVRNAYREKHPDKRCNVKVDITLSQYVRFLMALKKEMESRSSALQITTQ
jgi:N-acetyl-anhydromuramyl-L-alanine amidase AmpD